MKITNFKQKKLQTSNEGRIPLIKAKYYIIEDYSTSKIAYQQYKYQLRNSKYFTTKWMKELIKIKPNKELKVLKRNEIEPILSLSYEHLLSEHFGLEATLTKLKKKYY